MSLLLNNPLIMLGAELALELVTSMAQDLVRGFSGMISKLTNKLASPFAMFFSAMALALTAQVEVLMEVARGTARILVKKVAKKEEIIAKLDAEIIALGNAIAIVQKSSNHFDPYVKQLIHARDLVDSSDKKLKSVASILKSKKFYSDKLYARAVADLTTARDLSLPDKSANIKAIRSGHFMDAPAVVEAKDAMAAALTIPGITSKIAGLMVSYAEITLEINGLITTFSGALGTFIDMYERSDTVDNMTLDHLSEATRMADDLLTEMNRVLFPLDGDTSSFTFKAKVSGNATVWGMLLTVLIEWLKVEPGRASKKLDQTGESIRRYKLAGAILGSLSDIKVGTATLKVSGGKEDVIATALEVTGILVDANAAILARVAPLGGPSAATRVRKLSNLMVASQRLDAKIVAAVTPFINTPSNLIAGATSVVSGLMNLASSLGLDRAVALLSACDLGALLSMTEFTATFAGAGLQAARQLMSDIEKNPNRTDRDVAAMAKYEAELYSMYAAKQLEASRKSQDNVEYYVNQRKATTERIKKTTVEAAKVEVRTQVAVVQNSVTQLQEVTNMVYKFARSRYL